jgi:hypothetical protein
MKMRRLAMMRTRINMPTTRRASSLRFRSSSTSSHARNAQTDHHVVTDHPENQESLENIENQESHESIENRESQESHETQLLPIRQTSLAVSRLVVIVIDLNELIVAIVVIDHKDVDHLVAVDLLAIDRFAQDPIVLTYHVSRTSKTFRPCPRPKG